VSSRKSLYPCESGGGGGKSASDAELARSQSLVLDRAGDRLVDRGCVASSPLI
jgi:hypothetical protein